MKNRKIKLIMIVRAGWFGDGTYKSSDGDICKFSVNTYDAREDPPESLTKEGHGAIVIDGRMLDIGTAIDGAYKLPLLDVTFAPGMGRKLFEEVGKAQEPYGSLDWVALDIWTEIHRAKGYRIGRINDNGTVDWE
jgi:hypothetical protein